MTGRLAGSGRAYGNPNNYREIGMIEIKKVTNNTELLSRLLNSVARKYDCGAKFSTASGVLHYESDEACRQPIIDETLEMISRQGGEASI
jgi:hypothetical protein